MKRPIWMAITGFAESSRHLWVAKVSNDATLAVTSGVSENRIYLKKKQTNNTNKSTKNIYPGLQALQT